MAETFAPYHKWLGIPPKDQPANYYRLLGVNLFEFDLDVISSAADQRMAHIRTFQAGEHSAVSQEVLNEISRARLCLLDPEKKAEYDASLSGTEKVPCDTSAESAEDLELGEGAAGDTSPDDWHSNVQYHATLLESLKAERPEDQEPLRDEGQDSPADAGMISRLPTTNCPSCDGKVRIPDDWSQPVLRCRNCGAKVAVYPDSTVQWRPGRQDDGKAVAGDAEQSGSTTPLASPQKRNEPALITAGSLDGGERRYWIALAAIVVGLFIINLLAGRDTPHANGPNLDTEEASAVAVPESPEAFPLESGAADKKRPALPNGKASRSPAGEALEAGIAETFSQRLEGAIRRMLPALDHSTGNRTDATEPMDQPHPEVRPPGYLDWGCAFLKKRQPQRAVPFFSQAIEQDPTNTAAYKLRGHARLMAGELDDALTDFKRVAQLTPQDAEAYNNRGLAYEANGELD